MIAEQSGHVVPVDQPEVVVDAIRIVVEMAKAKMSSVAARQLQTVTVVTSVMNLCSDQPAPLRSAYVPDFWTNTGAANSSAPTASGPRAISHNLHLG